jgi:hypothetical protein
MANKADCMYQLDPYPRIGFAVVSAGINFDMLGYF